MPMHLSFLQTEHLCIQYRLHNEQKKTINRTKYQHSHLASKCLTVTAPRYLQTEPLEVSDG